MGYGHQLLWTCDNCYDGDRLGAALPGYMSIEEVLNENNWLIIGNKCYCPECKNVFNPKKEKS